MQQILDIPTKHVGRTQKLLSYIESAQRKYFKNVTAEYGLGTNGQARQGITLYEPEAAKAAPDGLSVDTVGLAWETLISPVSMQVIMSCTSVLLHCRQLSSLPKLLP